MNTAQVTLPTLFAELVVLAPLVTACIACIALLYNANLQRLAKSIDVVSDCHKRYETLLYEVRGTIGKELTFESYTRRYWELQNEQFLLWRLGFVPNQIFRTWLKRRASEHNLPLVPQHDYTQTAEQTWATIKSDLSNPAFVALMERLISRGYQSAYRRAYWRRFSRRVVTVVGVLVLITAIVVGILWAAFFLWPLVRDYVPVVSPFKVI